MRCELGEWRRKQ